MEVTDQTRAKALGGGLARQAAIAKMMRARQLEQAIDQATGGAPQAMPQQPAPQPQAQAAPPQAAMPYAQRTPQLQALQQQRLAEMLRRRQAAPVGQ